MVARRFLNDSQLRQTCVERDIHVTSRRRQRCHSAPIVTNHCHSGDIRKTVLRFEPGYYPVRLVYVPKIDTTLIEDDSIGASDIHQAEDEQ